MNYRKHLNRKKITPAVYAAAVLMLAAAVGGWIAMAQRDRVEKVMEKAGPILNMDKLSTILAERGLVLAKDEEEVAGRGNSSAMNAGWPSTVLYLDLYLEASRIINSYFRNRPTEAQELRRHLSQETPAAPTSPTSPESASGAAADNSGNQGATPLGPIVEIPWYVVFFGWEQYACFFLAALCWFELRRLRASLAAERRIAADTQDSASLNIPGAPIDPGSALAAMDRFSSATGKLIFGKRKGAELDPADYQRMQRYTWVAMVLGLLEVFRKTGDRLQALEAAGSAQENAQVRFEGRFHIEQYLQWAIPSIGFLGTIRGISAAMGAAQSADDLPIVVSLLGVAFYSTLTALILNLLLMGRRALTLSYADEIFAELDERLRRHVLPRLDMSSSGGTARRSSPRQQSLPKTASKET